MAASKVRLYIRPTLTDGKRPFLHPSEQRGRIREGWAVVNGQPVKTGGDYYLRYANQDGKRIMQHIGPHVEIALAAQARQEKAFAAIAAGVQVVMPAAKGETLGERIPEFIRHLTISGRQAGTVDDFAGFLESLKEKLGVGKQMSTITKDDLLEWGHWLRTERGLADSTIWFRHRKIRTFLLHYGLDVLKRREFPKYAERKPDMYTSEELQTIFAACTDEERLRYKLLFGTGQRKEEALHLEWRSLDLADGTITIQSCNDWKTKTLTYRTVPLPADLLADLKALRKAHPGERYVIGPGHSLLYRLKLIAFRSGLNCGCCVTKKGLSCATHPVCHGVTVQKLRRSYASHLQKSGIDLDVIREMLGHTTEKPLRRYLASPNLLSPALRSTLNGIYDRATEQPVEKEEAA